MSQDRREKVIEQVQKLWALADHPNTPEHEAKLAGERARDLMAKFQIDEIVLQEKTGKREAIILRSFRLYSNDKPGRVPDQRMMLAHYIATENRCRSIVEQKDDTVDVNTSKIIKGGRFLTVIGFDSDVRMVEELYFTVSMHMLEALMDEPLHTKTYETNFADGYVERIRSRLIEIRRTVQKMAESDGSSMALVLVDRKSQVESFFDNKFGSNLSKVRVSVTGHDPNARERGARKASTADLGQKKVGGDSRGELNG